MFDNYFTQQANVRHHCSMSLCVKVRLHLSKELQARSYNCEIYNLAHNRAFRGFLSKLNCLGNKHFIAALVTRLAKSRLRNKKAEIDYIYSIIIIGYFSKR